MLKSDWIEPVTALIYAIIGTLPRLLIGLLPTFILLFISPVTHVYQYQLIPFGKVRKPNTHAGNVPNGNGPFK